VISSLGQFSFAVSNVGEADAGAFVVSVSGVGTFEIGSLDKGDTKTRSWQTCQVGTMTATADAQNQIAESNESNNSRSFVIQKC
jgi:subtilase family serine protease